MCEASITPTKMKPKDCKNRKLHTSTPQNTDVKILKFYQIESNNTKIKGVLSQALAR